VSEGQPLPAEDCHLIPPLDQARHHLFRPLSGSAWQSYSSLTLTPPGRFGHGLARPTPWWLPLGQQKGQAPCLAFLLCLGLMPRAGRSLC